MFRYVVDVGFTTSRPIIVDEHFSRVVVMAESANDAIRTACWMVMCPGVEMPTSTEIMWGKM